MSQICYATIRSAVALPIQISPGEIEFAWDQVPLEISLFCEPLREYLLSLDAIMGTAQWESVFEIRESLSYPVKRIALKSGIAQDVGAKIAAYLNALMGRNSCEFDLLNPLVEDAADETIDLANRVRSAIGGKTLRQPVRIGVGDTELELSGRIPKHHKAADAVTDQVVEVFGYVDAPSVWNRTVQVQMASTGEKVSLHIDARHFLDILQVAQRDQRPCRMRIATTVDAKLNLIKTIQDIAISEQDEIVSTAAVPRVGSASQATTG